MTADRFIARKLKFQGRLAAVSIAVSFLVIIVAVAVSSGFRHSVRDGVSTLTGDVRISRSSAVAAEQAPLPVHLPSEETIPGFPGVESIRPVAVRAGIVRSGDVIHGVLVKGLPDRPDSSLCVSIPTRLSAITGLKEGDDMTTYFVGEKVRVRKFHVTEVHRDMLEMDDNLVVYANLADIQRLNGWSGEEASALEVTVSPDKRSNLAVNDLTDLIGMRLLLSGEEAEEGLVATSSVRTYPQIFDWLDLLDFNVLVILILMIVVAGFNMVSGLLIVLFRNIATIGTLKTLGMGRPGHRAGFPPRGRRCRPQGNGGRERTGNPFLHPPAGDPFPETGSGELFCLLRPGPYRPSLDPRGGCRGLCRHHAAAPHPDAFHRPGGSGRLGKGGIITGDKLPNTLRT